LFYYQLIVVGVIFDCMSEANFHHRGYGLLFKNGCATAVCALLCYVLSGLGLSGMANAQSARWATLADTVFQHLTVDQGLPHVIVTALAEDRHGFLWVGTQGGLARWDGYRFHTWQPDPKDQYGLPDNYIQTLFRDRQGRMWIGTNSAGLARYDDLHDRFIRISLGQNNSKLGIETISQDDKDGLWIGSRTGLEHYDTQTGKTRHYQHIENDEHSLPSDFVASSLFDKHGRLWIGTARGLAYFDALKQHFVAVPLPVKQGETRRISVLKQSKDGRIWIGSRGQGIFFIDPVSAQDGASNRVPIKVHALADIDTGQDLENEDVFGIEELENGQIWVATYGRGIVVWDKNAKLVYRVRHDPALASSLLSNTLWAIRQDRSGLVWIGTHRGLSRHDPGHAALLTVFGGAGRKVVDADVLFLTEMHDGSIWLGLHNQGINRIAPYAAKGVVGAVGAMGAAPEVTWLKPDTRLPDTALPPEIVHGMVQGQDGAVYIGTRHGLYRSSLPHNTVSYIALPPRRPRTSIYAMLMVDNQLWLGGGDGLWQLAFAADGSSFARRAPGTGALDGQSINVIEKGPDGALWIGTRHSGIYRYDLKTKSLQQIDAGPQGSARSAGLAHANIATLLFDKQGRLWIGTQGGGVSVLLGIGLNHRWRNITKAGGLPHNLVNKLLQDDSGYIWASTDDGLARIDPQQFAVQALRRPEGAMIQSYWTNSGVKTAQGELLFGGIGGLTVVRPEKRKPWHYQAPVMVSQILVGGKDLPVGPFNLAGDLTGGVRIDPNANSLAVEFSALDYSAPERNRYAYQLEGYDKGWIATDASRRLASYTNLPPGQYRLRLRGSNRNGEWNPKERVIDVLVIPGWYQTWMFRLGLGLFSLVAVYLLVQGRTRYLRQRQVDLANEVQQRVHELNLKQQQLLDANRDLAGANAALNESNTALSHANSGLALSVETLRQLGDIGRDITANLEGEKVFLALYQYIGALLDADALTIYRINEAGQRLDLAFGREDGADIPSRIVLLDSQTSITARVAREREQLMLDFDPGIEEASHIPGTRYMLSGLYAPLIVGERMLGVMSVQSHLAHAYGERERLIFRTLSSYGAIALANAEAMSALSQAQSQLVHQEKLVSLGTLTAGIAHEINNPSNFAHVGAYNLGTDLTALESYLIRLAGNDTPPQVMRTLSDHFERLRQSLATIQEGTTRIRDLVRDLRRFSRLDEADWRVVALGESLQATISLVRTQYADQLEIRCDMEANPEIACRPAQLNQVFMNLIVNACQAITMRPPEQQEGRPGLLQVRSRLEPEWLVLEFEDNGVGIEADIIKKIFDPFFTTKTVGDGMGMGLSIVFGIISKHKGQMTVDSVPGQGSCFTLRLPLVQPAAEHSENH
jgi:signal transduction histidine kinase/ligand-binding sensor domain-containing protein